MNYLNYIVNHEGIMTSTGEMQDRILVGKSVVQTGRDL